MPKKPTLVQAFIPIACLIVLLTLNVIISGTTPFPGQTRSPCCWRLPLQQ